LGCLEADVQSHAASMGRRAREIATALKEPVYLEPTNWIVGVVSFGLVAGTTYLAIRRERLHVTT
jgi:hypothetical protein